MKAVTAEGIEEAEAQNFYTTVRDWSRDVFGTTTLATAEAVANLKTSLREALMKTNMNRRDRNTVMRRMNQGLGETPTVDRVSLWTRVVEFLKRARVAGAAVALTAVLAACGGGDAQEPVTPAPTPSQSQSVEQPAPSETEAPVEEPEAPVENETSFTLDPASVEVPQDVVDAFGAEAAKNLVPDALSVASLANETADLHQVRDGDETVYWSVYDETMVTPELRQRIQENAAAYQAGDEEAGSRLQGLQPFVSRSGVLGTFDGEEFRIGERGIEVAITNTPTVQLSDHGRVAVDLPQSVTAYADNGKTLTYTRNHVLYLTPAEGGRWVLDTYVPQNISAVEVQ